ncbi:MAG: alpha/beta hydrolase [Erysipelotrichaceae bacterium]|nr:alpha/beta hydrolase [Erysipelotrichaceae bacterium]
MEQVTIAYTVKGSGRPLILLHGNSEDHTIFKETADVLANYFTVYTPDSRCHGQSTDTDELHYRDMAEDMIRLMERMDLRDVIFTGFSDGGIVGLIAAAKSDRITSLITCGANVTPYGVAPWLRLMIKCVYAATKDKKMGLMLKEPDITDEELKSIKAETLVCAGSKDLVKLSETEHIASAIPGAKILILPDETHTSYTVHSTKLADIILNFVF